MRWFVADAACGESEPEFLEAEDAAGVQNAVAACVRWDHSARQMSRAALGGSAARVDPGCAVDETGQLSFSEGLDQSEAVRRTRVWRLDQFTALGFDSAQAVRMADDALVDLAQARRLIALGCPLETASRILL